MEEDQEDPELVEGTKCLCNKRGEGRLFYYIPPPPPYTHTLKSFPLLAATNQHGPQLKTPLTSSIMTNMTSTMMMMQHCFFLIALWYMMALCMSRFPSSM